MEKSTKDTQFPGFGKGISAGRAKENRLAGAGSLSAFRQKTGRTR